MGSQRVNQLFLRYFVSFRVLTEYDPDMLTNIKIVTASWRVPIDTDKFLRVGISRMPPRHLRGYRTYPPLFPGPWWRSISEPSAWAARYQEDLDRLDPAKVIADLAAMVPDVRGIALCCWEPPPPSDEWCHRGLVSFWLYSELGGEVPELGHESHGCGRRHPKLCSTLHR
jgi:hypothetical protein